MSRWYRTGQEQEGYEARQEANRWEPYPYEKSYEYREGWEDAERELRRAEARREEEEAERAFHERAEERRRQEAEHLRREEEDRVWKEGAQQ